MSRFDEYLSQKGSDLSPQNVSPQDSANPSGVQAAPSRFDQYEVSKSQQNAGAKVLEGPPTLENQATQESPIGLSPAGTAFAKGAVGMVVPESFTQQMEDRSIATAPQSLKDLVMERRAQEEKAMSDNPYATLAGQGVGLFAAGALSEGASQVFQRGLSHLAAKQITSKALDAGIELGALSTQGAMFSILNDRPNTFEDAVKSGVTGGLIALTLGTAGKTVAKFDDNLVNKYNLRVSDYEKRVALSEQEAWLKAQDLKRAEEAAQRSKKAIEDHKSMMAASHTKLESDVADRLGQMNIQKAEKLNEFNVVQDQLGRRQDILATEPQINIMVSELPNRLDDTLQTHIDEVGQVIGGKINLYKDKPIPVSTHYQDAISYLESKLPKRSSGEFGTEGGFTPREQAIRSAIQDIKNKMVSVHTTGSSPQDIAIGAFKKPEAKVGPVYQQTQDLGKMLYERDFLANAPTEVRAAYRDLYKSNRDMVAGIDPTGELSQHMDFQHSLLNAKERDGFTRNSPEFFKEGVVDESKSGPWRKFRNNLRSREDVANKFGPGEAFDTGFKPETLKNPDLKRRADDLNTAIEGMVIPATDNYQQLKQVKKEIPQFQSRVESLQDHIDAIRLEEEKIRNAFLENSSKAQSAGMEKASSLEIQAENKAYAIEKAKKNNEKSLFSLTQDRGNFPAGKYRGAIKEAPVVGGTLDRILGLKDWMAGRAEQIQAPERILQNNSSLKKGLNSLKNMGLKGAAITVPSLGGATRVFNTPPEQGQ